MNKIFSLDQVVALCGGQLPSAGGFDWKRVGHFSLEDGLLQPYSGKEILPGAAIEVMTYVNDDSQDHHFRVENSFNLAVQVPDDTVGCSGSRCSNCNEKGAYCHQICRSCGLPFIGPFGFPQLPEWKSLRSREKRLLVEKVYSRSDHGRLEYTNVMAIPLTKNELGLVEALRGHDAELFEAAHGIKPADLQEKLTP